MDTDPQIQKLALKIAIRLTEELHDSLERIPQLKEGELLEWEKSPNHIANELCKICGLLHT